MSWYDPRTWFNSPKMTGKSVGHHTYANQKNRFFNFRGKEIYFSLDTEDDYRKIYNTCPPVKAIIGKRASMFLNGKIEIINKNTQNTQRGPNARLLRDKLKRPNVLQTWRSFFVQFHTYIDLFGYCPVLKVNPAGMNDEISSLWCLPPWLFDVEFTGKWREQTELKGIYKAFYFTWGGVKKQLDMDNICLVLDSGIGTDDDGNLLMPDARLKGTEYQVSNIMAALKTRNTLIVRKGAIGILSNIGRDQAGPMKLEKKDKDALQEDFARYGLTGEEWQVIITDASLQWQSMTFPTKEMMLFEEVEEAILRLCDQLGLYSDLTGTIKKSTFANQSEAKKAQYQDYIITDAENRIEQLSAFLISPDENATLQITFDHIEVLQKSKKEEADGLVATNTAFEKLYQSGLCTKNDWAMAVKMKPVTDGDKYIFDVDDQTPLAVKLGVGGTQSLQSILESSSIKAEQKKQILIIVFGIKDSDAEALAGEDEEVDPNIIPPTNGKPKPNPLLV